MGSLGRPGIFRADKSGLNEELVYNPEDRGLLFTPLLLFPGGNDLLAAGFPFGFESKFHFLQSKRHQPRGNGFRARCLGALRRRVGRARENRAVLPGRKRADKHLEI